MSPIKLSIADHFADIPDPRRAQGRRHLIGDIFALALCAVIAGANSWEQAQAFGVAKFDWLAERLQLPNGIPSHDTIRRLFCLVRPRHFEACFVAWMNATCAATGLQPIHIDGKTLRGSRRATDGTFAEALHLVSAFAGANNLTLGQVGVEGKSNEITAIPELLRTLDLKGCIVTIDAMGCQKEIARQIHDGHGGYVLGVKATQPTLYGDIDRLFERALAGDFKGYRHEIHVTHDRKHGRRETRTYLVIYDPKGLSTKGEWAGLKAVVMVTRERTAKGKTSLEHGYYISNEKLTAKQLAEVIRGHWTIENGLHWILDVVFKEDASRTQDETGASNLAFLRKVALSLLRNSPGKGSTPTKRLVAGLDENFLLEVLAPLFGPRREDSPSSNAAPPGTR